MHWVNDPSTPFSNPVIFAHCELRASDIALVTAKIHAEFTAITNPRPEEPPLERIQAYYRLLMLDVILCGLKSTAYSANFKIIEIMQLASLSQLTGDMRSELLDQLRAFINSMPENFRQTA